MEFEEDLNVLRISKGDYLIAVQVGEKHIDIHKKEADDVTKLITDARKERNTLQCPVTPCHPLSPPVTPGIPYPITWHILCNALAPPGSWQPLAPLGTPWHPLYNCMRLSVHKQDICILYALLYDTIYTSNVLFNATERSLTGIVPGVC